MNIGKIKIVLRWVFGVFSILAVLAYISTSVPASIVWFLLSALLLPPIERLWTSRIPIQIPTVFKVIAGIVLFIIVFAITPKTQVADQKQNEELPAQEQIQVTVAPSPTPLPSPSQQSTLYSVISVIDGDTIKVTINGQQETLRLIGIDSPETVDPRKPVQCFGKEASAKAKSLLTGKSVSLESDPTQGERDKYQRLLRYVFLEDGTSFNKLMISEGFAHEYTYDTPYKYQSEFKQAQKDAETNKTGLWADNACPTSTPQPSPVKTTGNANTTTSGVNSGTTGTSGGSSGTTGSFTCSGKTACGQMSSCAEAEFYLNSCGVSRLDGDKDGVPCESLCN